MISLENKKVLILAPYPDEQIFGCGGAKPQLKREGEHRIGEITVRRHELPIGLCRNPAASSSSRAGLAALRPNVLADAFGAMLELPYYAVVPAR